MKRLFVLFGGIFTLALTGPVLAATVFQATLTGDQEVPVPIVTDAFGTAILTLNDAQTRLVIDIQLFGLDLDGNQTPGTADDNVTASHIHFAPAGSNGGVVFGFISPNHDTNGDLIIDPVAGTISSAWDLLEGSGSHTLANNLANLFAGNLYINVHTMAVPGGEIRGQIGIVPIPAAVWLFGSGLLGLIGVTRRKKA